MRHHRPARAACAAVALALLLGACGQKGPLYLPDEPADEDDDAAQEQAG